MKKKKNAFKGLKRKKGKDPQIHSLIVALEGKDGMARQHAREELVAIGIPAVEYLADLIEQPDATLRWEAVKALGEIADPDSAPLFIFALEDEDEEVRWLAAEGLMAIGRPAVEPVLKKLIKTPKSVYIRKGAHHFFSDYREKESNELYNTLLSALEGQDAELHAPVVAEKILKSHAR